MQQKHSKGFTIVELLIVIVVIAILAAITIVGYNGVQASANDVAVQSDLRNAGSKALEFNVKNGRYPLGDYDRGIEGLTFRLARGSYDARFGVGNFFYCEGPISGMRQFAFVARSKSSKVFIFRSDSGGVSQYNGAMDGYPVLCPALGFSSYTPAYGFFQGSDGGWYDWTK